MSRCPQANGQGIEQSLGQGEALLTPAFAGLVPGPGGVGPLAWTRQGEQCLQMVEEAAGAMSPTTNPAVHRVRMTPPSPARPAVVAAATPPSDGPVAPAEPERSPKPQRLWPEGSAALAEQLHRRLAIGDRDWHALKAQRSRRAAEQLAAALVVLLSADGPTSSAASPARAQALALVEHAAGWLRGEISDPGCPSHGR